jgi:hypothetical protein
MKKLYLFASMFVLFAAGYGNAQATAENDAGPIRSSPAYAEIILRKTELQAELEAVLPDYTDTNPKILDLRFEISALNKAIEKVYGVKPSDTGKLTLALGKLLVKRASLETDLARLLRTFTNEHNSVKRARRQLEIYDAAVKEILP